MQRSTLFVSVLSVALTCAAVGTIVAAETESPVLSQDLNKVRASGKVLAALWTVRKDSCTLQLVLPVSTTAPLQAAQIAASRQSPASRVPRQAAEVQVWLLNPNGTQVLPASQSPAPKPEQLDCTRCISYELSYSFPLAAGKEAVAAAVRINDDFYIERLESLGDEKK